MLADLVSQEAHFLHSKVIDMFELFGVDAASPQRDCFCSSAIGPLGRVAKLGNDSTRHLHAFMTAHGDHLAWHLDTSVGQGTKNCMLYLFTCYTSETIIQIHEGFVGIV
uniref:Uncharacterized protein LOC105040835 n=1 Tax=Elaeis guineensis var. tenera TaxID=51953 RepID=A0A6I9QX12_ELAGV|nr:uncharacterized protein LOC105040835 [Elaeis guineensis]